jgi:hypothetical protein
LFGDVTLRIVGFPGGLTIFLFDGFRFIILLEGGRVPHNTLLEQVPKSLIRAR